MVDNEVARGRLAGKVAIISGAARGQGAAEARLFVAEGAEVVVADVLEAEGRALAAELGDGAAFFALDVRVSYALPLQGASRLQLVGEIFNLTDRANFNNPGGDQRLSSFLDVRSLRQGNTSRKGQISFRYSF